MQNQQQIHATTILCLKKDGKTAIAGDGQVSLGHTIFKSTAKKLRTSKNGKIISGFAGSAADGITLFDRMEAKLEKYSYQLRRAAVELAKDWRTDKYLRKLEAMMIVADSDNILILSGTGDVIEPDDGVAAIGSGGVYALSAARAFLDSGVNLTAEQIAKKSMKIAADICVYTNNNIITETLSE